MELEEAALLLLTMTWLVVRQRRRGAAVDGRRRGAARRWWVHPINKVRPEEGAWSLLMQRFRDEFPEKHTQSLRMTKESFDEILVYVLPMITKNDTCLRKSIPAEQRLCVTLFFLSTGDSFKTTAMFFRMGESTVRFIVYETCKALWDSMCANYLQTPTTADKWRAIANDFQSYWNFPHCVGAIDGKHCAIQAPANSGSEFFNYKKHFSVVLMAACDATYKFIYVDVGTPGQWSDGGTFDNCSLNTELSEGRLGLPADDKLPTDEAFPLNRHIMRPIPGRSLDSIDKVYNYRLSRARRTIENAFGIMVSRWRCLRRPLLMLPDNASSVVMACCVLHNFLRAKRCTNYCPPGYTDSVTADGVVTEGGWRQEERVLQGIQPPAHRNPPVTAAAVRETFISYFRDRGSLPWQVQHVNRT